VIRHLREPMALLLMVAAAISGLGLGERVNAIAILAIVALNAVIGLVQEGRAASALEALRSMETPTSRVLRDGVPRVIASRLIVPGDVVVLSAGDRVPADLQLSQADAMEVDESTLTGESLPVVKAAGDQAHAGTLITRGSGTGTVSATGSATRLGSIAEALRRPQPPTPLQLELGRLTGRLGGTAVVIAIGVLALILVRTGLSRESLERSFLAAVALAVAAVPEGLATVVTVALALGVRRMAAAGAIIRRLPAVETLGSTTVVLTDKTGTLTENRIRVQGVAPAGARLGRLEELPELLRGRFEEVMALCNDASLDPPAGDPMDLALLEVLAAERVTDLRGTRQRLGVIPFDSGRARMTALYQGSNGPVVLIKGAPEGIINLSSAALDTDGEPRALSPGLRTWAFETTEELAGQGMRVLALARRDLEGAPTDLEAEEKGAVLVGLVGLADPLRPEAAATVAQSGAAGIRLVMVTGDHPGTAEHVAAAVGITAPGRGVMEGSELTRHGLPSDPLGVSVYARVEPGHKLALVEALQERGEVVAVTGDGVNDAPALRRADIGVAMGRSGSDVAREAADMVVTDDNLATIVGAVREGRGIYDNVRKVVDYLVAGNLSEIMVVVSGLLIFPDLGIPLLPLQLLWINLLTDGLPALALGIDPVAPDVMRRPPRRRGEPLLSVRRLQRLGGRGLIIAAASVASLAVSRLLWEESWARSRALMFTVLVTAHLLYALAVGGRNRWLYSAIGSGIALQVAVVLLPVAQPIFATAALDLREWVLVLVAGVLPTAIIAGFGRAKTDR
jgi:Ca2+-transporting ATPase